MDAIHQKYAKPPMLTEFSTEYQAELVIRTIEVLRQKPYVIGEHVWNMCDFKTSQGTKRVSALNHKGVFTRDRRPRLMAHRLCKIWGAK